jgi:hypothetical protein
MQPLQLGAIALAALADHRLEPLALGAQLLVAERLQGLLVLVDLFDQRAQAFQLPLVAAAEDLLRIAGDGAGDEAHHDADAAEQQGPVERLRTTENHPDGPANDGPDDDARQGSEQDALAHEYGFDRNIAS